MWISKSNAVRYQSARILSEITLYLREISFYVITLKLAEFSYHNQLKALIINLRVMKFDDDKTNRVSFSTGDNCSLFFSKNIA